VGPGLEEKEGNRFANKRGKELGIHYPEGRQLSSRRSADSKTLAFTA